MPRKKIIKEEFVKPKEYSVTLDILGQKYKADGDTIIEALDKIIIPTLVKGKGTLTAERDGKTFSIFLMPARIKSLLVNKVYRAILAKRLSVCLK